MKIAPRTGAWVLLATLVAAAHAEAPKSREAVQAELREAIRTGDVIAAGESGLKMNERCGRTRRDPDRRRRRRDRPARPSAAAVSGARGRAGAHA